MRFKFNIVSHSLLKMITQKSFYNKYLININLETFFFAFTKINIYSKHTLSLTHTKISICVTINSSCINKHTVSD